MKTYTAREIFRRRFKGSKNFMTPNVEKYGKVNRNVAYELSSGRGFSGGTMYGVTVVAVGKGGKTRSLHEKSKSFSSKSKAMSHVYGLQAKMGKFKKKR